MKKTISFALVILLLLSLTACTQDTAAPTTPTGTEAATPVDPDPAPDPDPDPDPDSKFPYLLTVESLDELIFAEPTYDSTCVGTVLEAGVFTITEEATDDEGNVWGKLKSGKGWLNLASVEENNAADLVMTAAKLTGSEPEHALIANEKYGYATAVIFHAYKELTNVRIYSLAWDGETYEPSEHFYMAPEMDTTTPIVAYLEFAGSMSMYGVSFQDAAGNFHHYRVSTNGRNDAIEFNPYDPNS